LAFRSLKVVPPVPEPGPTDFWEPHTYAVVTLGKITAEVRRIAYRDPREGQAAVEITHEVRIEGLPETGGFSDIFADDRRP
jgi:hypothetical protein